MRRICLSATWMDIKSNPEIEEIIASLKCPKDFICCRSELKKLCRARDIGLDSFLECLEMKPESCEFAFSFGLIHLCKCPLRVYLFKKLKK
jgi:hypothetical protein